MATELNLDLLRGMGFDAAGRRRAQRPGRRRARRRTTTPSAGRCAALEQAAGRGLGRPAGGDGLGGAARAAHRRRRPPGDRRTPTWRWSRSPGRTPSPRRWTRSTPGLSVLVFSDNVPVEQEVGSRTRPRARGLLVMGPDCGTAVVGGVGLGFANVVRPGPVGLVAASRHRRPAGDVPARRRAASASATASASAAATCPPRSAAARPARRCDLLDADPATELIVVVSKPPDPAVAAERHGVRRRRWRTPVLLALLGPAGSRDLTDGRRGRPSRRVGGTWRRAAGRWDGQPAPTPAARCAGCSPAARCATRRC